MKPANNSLRISRKNGSISKSKRKDKDKSKRDSKIRCTPDKLTNSIE